MEFEAKVIWIKPNEEVIPATDKSPEVTNVLHHSARLYAEVRGHGVVIEVTTPDNAEGFRLNRVYNVTIVPA